MRYAIPAIVVCLICYTIGTFHPTQFHEASDDKEYKKMNLGNFSVSLNVKDLKASITFYEKLGFKQSGGNVEHNYIVMQNDTSTVGLYQGMFDKNMLTFNPGWDRDCNTLKEYQDVRSIQAELRKRGIEPVVAADESTDGPAYLTLTDPDGNPILIDQHVAKPSEE